VVAGSDDLKGAVVPMRGRSAEKSRSGPSRVGFFSGKLPFRTTLDGELYSVKGSKID